MGHTGSGKSSIINLLFRFYDPQQGSITIDGQKVKDLPKQWLRSHMGIVLQDPYLFTGTIASNVSLGDERISRERVERALREVGADKLLAHLPQGFDEPVIEKGSTLSAGQRQLISFARALSFDPAILILDEATSNIDTETESIIQQALEVLKKAGPPSSSPTGCQPSAVRTRFWCCTGARLSNAATMMSLMAQGGRYFRMYQLQLVRSRERLRRASSSIRGPCFFRCTPAIAGADLIQLLEDSNLA